ncbi:hypothetical protein PG996_014024 [Apiospora saccharicola]|uniref:Uncharacterized protein n=1 Tax=Apiospora saccharicola TaxID=335842 RepID=A0ABR1TH49_9PEZI
MKSFASPLTLLLAACSQVTYGSGHGNLHARGDKGCAVQADMKLCSGGNGTGTCYPNTFKFQKCYDLAGEWAHARTLTPHQTWYDCYAYTGMSSLANSGLPPRSTPCSDITTAAEAECLPAMDCDLKVDNTEIGQALFFPGTDYRSWDLKLYNLQDVVKSFACFSRLPSGHPGVVGQ